jgi:lysophospholipase
MSGSPEVDARSAQGTAVAREPARPFRIEDIQPRFIYARDGRSLRIATVFGSRKAMPRGTCVLLNGQTEFIEKYVEVIGELSARGFTVATMDWRGQGGSSRLLDDPLKAHIVDFSQYDSDLRVFMDTVVRSLTDRPPIVLAHSMGAHILLRALHANPAAFSAAILTAPMLRALTRGYPPKLARAICHAENFFGQQSNWVLGMAKRDPLNMTFADQLVTSDEVRFARTQDFLRDHPNLRLAGPTWGWLEAAYRSMDTVMAPGYGEAITTPLLVFGAGHDRIVDTMATREFCGRLPHCRYEEFANSEHEILMENDDIRSRFWKSFDVFVPPYTA